MSILLVAFILSLGVCCNTPPASQSTTQPSASDEEQAVTIGNEFIEIAARRALKKWGEPLYRADLLKVTELELRQGKLSDISGLTLFEGLTHLWLSDNSISDITPLKGLTKLEALPRSQQRKRPNSITGNQVAQSS